MEPSTDMTRGWTLDAFMATIHEGRVALWSWHPEARYAVLDPLAREMWGGLDGERHALAALFDHVHPADREAMQAAWWASSETSEAYEFDFRVGAADDPARWISARGVGGAAGRSGDEVLAVFVDVTRLHQANEARDRLVREMAHRTANLFTVAQSMVRLSAIRAEDPDDLAAELERRFTGLSDAYRFGVTQSGALGQASLHEVADRIMAPFAGDNAVEVAIPDVPVRGDQVTNLAVILHELTTNAVKYGALSAPGGTLSLTGEATGGMIALRWREAGGPRLTKIPHSEGFGTRLVDVTVAQTFGGGIERRIEDGALAVDLTLDAALLAG